MAISFFPPASPSTQAHHRKMAPPTVPSSSPFGPTRHAPMSSTTKTSSTVSFKDRLVFKKKTPLMASNHTRITSGYATPTTSSPGRENQDVRQTERVQLERPLKPFSLPHTQQRSPPRSSSSSSSATFLAGPPPKATTTKTLLSNPRAKLMGLPASSADVTSSAPPVVTVTLPALVTSTPLILGRRLTKPTRLSSTPAFAATHLKLAPTGPCAGLEHVALPRHALHASRLHCIVEPLFSVRPGVVRVVVLGQNGMKVMGKKVRQGETVLVDVINGGEVTSDGLEPVVLRLGRPHANASGLRLDFWGSKVLIPWGEGEGEEGEDEEMDCELASAEHASRREDRSSSPLTEDEDEIEINAQHEIDQNDDDELDPSSSRPHSEAGGDHPDGHRQTFSSLPPSSPPPLDFLAHRSSSPDLSLALFPSSPPRVLARPIAPLPVVFARPTTPPPQPLLRHLVQSSPAESHHSYTFSPPPSPPSSTSTALPAFELPSGPIPAMYDLPSLMSSTLVFSHQTSMSLPDLVRAVLETQPGMKDEGSEEQWKGWCAGVLRDEIETEGMFGRIERKGKDASGQPLLDLFFYDPARDPDQVRAKDLGGLMRPLRGTQRQGKTYFFKRPSTPGKKRK